MQAPELLAYPCGKGTIEVLASVHRNWKIEKISRPCQNCGSDDIKAARDAQAPQPEK